MLTEQEQQWLNTRPNYPSMLLSGDDDDDICCESWAYNKNTCRWWLALIEDTDALIWKNAAVLEARVAKLLAERICDAYSEGYYDHENAGSWERFDPEPWDELKQARLKVEEEIDCAD